MSSSVKVHQLPGSGPMVPRNTVHVSPVAIVNAHLPIVSQGNEGSVPALESLADPFVLLV